MTGKGLRDKNKKGGKKMGIQAYLELYFAGKAGRVRVVQQ